MKNYQQIYDAINEDFSELESEVLRLERAYFDSSKVFIEIENRLEQVLRKLKKKKASPLSRRVANLKSYVSDLKKKKGYNPRDFSRLQKLASKLKDRAPTEIFPNKLLDELKKRIKEEKPPEPAPGFDTRTSKKFLMVQNGSMHFLVEYYKKLWQNTVPNRKPLKLRLKNIAGTYEFEHLPGYEIERAVPTEKIAILIQKKDGSKSAFLVDSCAGTLFLKPALLKNKVQYVKAEENSFRPYVRLKGERYFLRS